MCQYLANVIFDGVPLRSATPPPPPPLGLSVGAVQSGEGGSDLIWPYLFAPNDDVARAHPLRRSLLRLTPLSWLLKEHIIILTRSTLWGLLLNTQTRVCAGAMW